AKLQQGPAGTKTASVRDPNYENPPPAYVKGKVEKVLPGQNLVEINLGSDMGVNKDNTLEVYRMRPRPEYLGRLRIVDAHHRTAIGQMVRTGGAAAPTLREGDEVASTIR